MIKNIEYNIWDNKKEAFNKVIFEIQEMDPFIYTKANTNFLRNLDLEEFAKVIFNEMIVSPKEAKEIEYWKNDIEGINEFSLILSEFQEGFYKPKQKRPKYTWKKEQNLLNEEV